MRIAFIFAPYRHKCFEEDVAVVSREFGTFAPLGLGYAAAISERAGHETILIDAHAEKLNCAQILERLKPFRPDLLGFMLTTYMFHDTLQLIAYLKKETSLPTVVGNVNMELYPWETMAYPEIDYGIIGSALDALPALLGALQNGTPIPDMPGLCHKSNGNLVLRKPDRLWEDFSRLPFPKRDGLPHHLYHSVMSKRKNLANMVTSKGCHSACTFCHIHRTPYTARSAQGVCDEIEECVTLYDVREIEIFDPSFTMDRERVLFICREIVERGLDVQMACRLRVDQVDPELLQWMARAGFRRLLYGIESGSPELLRRLRKDITKEQARRAVKMTQDAGMQAIGFFLIGVPGETLTTIEQTVHFAIDLNVDYAQFHRVMAKPGTDLHRQTIDTLGFDYWRRFVMNSVPEERLPTPWTELTHEQVEREVFRAYRRFYSRPSFLWKTLTSLKSREELQRYFRSGIGLLLGQSDLSR